MRRGIEGLIGEELYAKSLVLIFKHLFQGVRDRYSGVTVSSNEEPVSVQDLEQILQGNICDINEDKTIVAAI